MVGAAEQGRKRHGRRIRHNFYRNERKRPRERLGRERLRGSDPARGAAARRQASRGASRPTGREVRVGDAGKDEASSFDAPFGNPCSPGPIRRTREDSASSGEGTMDPSPRSPLDRAAARDAALDLVGSPKRGRPATIAPQLTPATSSSRAGNDASYASSSRTPVPSIDELAPTTSTSSDGLQCVDLETGVREIIARETPVGTSDISAGGSSALSRMIKRGMDRKIPKPVWTAVGLLWLYAIVRLILGA